MAPKRKSDVLEAETSFKENEIEIASAGKSKKARVDASSSSSGGKGKSKEPVQWQDVELDTNPDGTIPVFDYPGDVRRKIKALSSTPGFKVTHWLKEIGNINSNSHGRFMKEKGKTDGAANGTYYAAYVYFERVRIAEGKAKSAGRKQNEIEYPRGLPLEDRRKVWVFTGR
ncbi:hypothetical protein B0H16DRAFT_17638 [Mycena metata]|uniref:DUF7726 domain-containing protein n=1 Tax=Mycena metata TaxID=1033252 RepID=A0AAD7KKZ3_9AGAR|nr:hypothetical protein B0H16DRAFT_17638 [Mycena metata]